MYALLIFFGNMALMRRKPQDLPVSSPLLATLVGLNLVLGAIVAGQAYGGMGRAAAAAAVDALVVILALWLMLMVRGFSARLMQTATSVFGVGVLFNLVNLPLVLLLSVDQNTGALLLLVSYIWQLLAIGHVLRHALQMPLFVGFLLAISMAALVMFALDGLFPPVQA